MTYKKLNLASSRVLISNDDGIRAPGIQSLIKVCTELFAEVWVSAPEREQSAASHSLTLRRPLRIIQYAQRQFSVDGTPTDSVMLGLKHIMRDRPPDLVISGINAGMNAGEMVFYSGTVAAALEAALLGFPSMAISLATESAERHWSTAEFFTIKVLDHMRQIGWPLGAVMNVNVPNLPVDQVKGVKMVHQGLRTIPRGAEANIHTYTDPRGQEYYWIGAWDSIATEQKQSDLAQLVDGHVTMTPIQPDLTNYEVLKHMQGVLE